MNIKTYNPNFGSKNLYKAVLKQYFPVIPVQKDLPVWKWPETYYSYNPGNHLELSNVIPISGPAARLSASHEMKSNPLSDII